MNEEQKAAEAKAIAEKAEADAKAKAEADAKNPQEDVLKKELEKINEKKGVTKKDRLLFAKKKIENQLSDMETEEGIETPLDEDRDKPVTVGMLEQREREKATKTALQLAEALEDETERELVKHHLEITIKPSGNPNTDYKAALAIVNSLKNAQIIEEATRVSAAKGKPTAPGAPAKHEPAFEPTSDEMAFMAPPWNLSKEDIIKAREKVQAQQ